MRKQFLFLLKEASLIDNIEGCSKLSYDDHIVRVIICAALFPGICSVVVSCCRFCIYFTFPLLAIVSTFYSLMSTLLKKDKGKNIDINIEENQT